MRSRQKETKMGDALRYPSKLPRRGLIFLIYLPRDVGGTRDGDRYVPYTNSNAAHVIKKAHIQ